MPRFFLCRQCSWTTKAQNKTKNAGIRWKRIGKDTQQVDVTSKGVAKPQKDVSPSYYTPVDVTSKGIAKPIQNDSPRYYTAIDVTSKGGAKLYSMIAQDIIQLLMPRAKAGRSPNRNIAQGNTLGERSLAHWRAVSAKGASEVSFSQFPFALTARQYVGIYLPRVLPWVIFRLGFQPVFAACKPSYLIVRADSSSWYHRSTL